ncbi:ABC transporter ATP-binding protein [Rhodococcus erythropolis]|jgi:ATP-binding cassette subfamily B protein|uniref:ABC transporter ATP-binding protein n=1 Tax=Rhodococcus baikonurensis TaxID=172041 RepID=A0ABV5XTL1_9NOCA|nr:MULTISPECIES: ABC transporter ATP-binding protein [Rhodococcus]NHP17472.1 ABC transporter ATP-binding protein [Rhodococcus sp. IC4_135]MBJ7477564.1 ABC transporter ATP-binding protein [Rhodococcus sp. (in: high G+C Gram-positive bacteria)]PBI99991.1 putative ABC transporter ATP-binding protein [Rhodococcus erythropolis]QQM24647.1 ABC transporter ATP-binding protein [Rhodococcus sp. P-2]RQO50734.1 ABC transporter ATP-binding protein [Rhodococcus sp. KBW08]
MLIRLLRTYLTPYRGELTGVVVLQFISTMAALYLPSLNADIIDNGVTKGDTGYILSTGGMMLMVTLTQILCSVGAVFFGARVAMGVGRDLRASVLHQVGTFSAREVGHFGAPSLITRNTNDVQQVQMMVVMSCTILVMAPIMCVGGIIMALRQDLNLSWILGVSVPLLVISMGFLIARMVPGFRVMQGRLDAVNRVLREQITGIRVVRAFVREPYEVERFGDANRELTETALGVGRLMALMFPLVMLISNVTSVAVIWFGGHQINEGSMQIGSLTAMLSYIMQILMAVMMATFMAVMLPRASVCAERISEVLDTDSSVIPPENPIRELKDPGVVELRGAQFQFPGAEEPVLRDITFRAEPGKTTAIIGGTGSGKTTLLNLIPRLIDSTSGSVSVGGVDVRDIDTELLCSVIGLVPQKPYLFSGTVATNLRYGNPEATDEWLWECLEIAQAADFVRAMPEGLDTPVAQGGTTVSGGQRQRLAIARALVRKPQIYLFDDSFSALDLTTDARLRAALRPVTQDACIVVVAQRISTIVEADQIIVLDDGAIVGIGTHDELVVSCPTYGEIVASQLAVQDAS